MRLQGDIRYETMASEAVKGGSSERRRERVVQAARININVSVERQELARTSTRTYGFSYTVLLTTRPLLVLVVFGSSFGMSLNFE